MVHQSSTAFPELASSQNALFDVLEAFHKVFGDSVYAIYLGLSAAVTSLVRHKLEHDNISNFPIWVLYGQPGSGKTTLLKAIGAMTGIPQEIIVSGKNWTSPSHHTRDVPSLRQAPNLRMLHIHMFHPENNLYHSNHCTNLLNLCQ